MTTTPTSGAADLASRLRNACASVRSKSYPLADLIPLMQQAADALASTPARAAEPSITLDFKMATDLLGMFCGEPGLVTLQRGDEHCHSGPGLYAWYSDMPEEGAGFLGAEPDDEATPSAPSAPAQPVAEPAKSAAHGQAPAQPDPAYSEACNLATALFKKHFAHLPDYASGQVVWGLCDSTAGVISQIDNMVSGLVQPPTTSPQADSVQEDAARLDWLLLRVSGAEFRRIGVHYSGNARRADVDAARKQGANHD